MHTGLAPRPPQRALHTAAEGAHGDRQRAGQVPLEADGVPELFAGLDRAQPLAGRRQAQHAQ
eukprot:5932749-Alexandrium_andersonii.AAC.1